MPALVVRLWRLYHTPNGKKMFRYSMVSVISTIVSFLTLQLIYGKFRLWTEVPSTIFANVTATIPSYYLNRRWAWGKTGRSHVRREVIPFWSLSVAGMALSIVAASLVRHFGNVHHFHHTLQTVLLQAANLSAFGVLWIVKFLVFNRLFHVSVLEEEPELVEV